MARDLACARGVGELGKLGAFDTEFIMYGCGYVEEGKIKYRISSEAMNIYQFIEESGAIGIYPTPLMRKSERCAVPSGRREDIAQEIKVKLAREIKATYSKAFFAVMEEITTRTASNGAYEQLKQWQEQLEGLFDAEKLTLFESLVGVAYGSKVLNEESYREIGQWIRKNRRQMEDDVVVKEVIEKQFYGFAHENDRGEIVYVYNALEEMVHQKKAKLNGEGKLTTPILAKTYYFTHLSNVSKVRDEFLGWLKGMLGTKYLGMLKEIKSLPSFISAEEFEAGLARIEADGMQEAVDAYRNYGYCWNIR